MQRFHQFDNQSCPELTVNQLELFNVIWDWVSEDGAHRFDRCSIDRAQTIYQCLEVLHLGDSFENNGQLITRDSTVVKEHTVDNRVVKELTSFSQSLTITVTQVVVLKAESFSVDLVKDRQGHV